ncbi:Nephrocystin-3 [Fusarium albosuccineum]|uniref:Nephrocystin-3 n=1 Tax=Fusarium albosuccineum TaxID=1237068 RepID=A0A8H4P674_9HYPO|nr:Nephrocystin-3 [Fusarium albosuccineum]
MASQPARPNSRRGFETAIICALPLEADAVEALFDRHWDDDGLPFDKAPGDLNAYSTGVIGRHNVVLAYMPGMGKANAATVASNCRASFPSIKLALVVGVCGVVPFGPHKEEILLGDVIISDGIIQYDFGRQLPGHFIRKDTLMDSLGRPNQEIRSALEKLKTLRGRQQLGSKVAGYLDVLRQEPELRAEYPGSANDKLFKASYSHAEDQQSFEQLGCDGELVPRSRLKAIEADPTPAIHSGLMASGDSVMKSGEDRDRIATEDGIIAFEMEGAGVWDSFPCLVIKGACDYADSHKSKVWQRYAAATAAACMKAFLSHWVPSIPADGEIADSGTRGRRRIHDIPFPKNKDFVGREDTIATLKGMLFTEICDQQVALVGLGGMGKTQVALHLAHWVKDNKRDHSVFWIPALSMASFKQACGKLVKKLGIQCDEQEDAKEAVRQYLGSEDAGSWFMVVDNADDMAILDGSAETDGLLDFLPQSDAGRILFTTRSQKVAVTSAGNAVVRLSEMSTEEASTFLQRSLIQSNQVLDAGVLTELLEQLTHLPLAIAQAAAYMNMNLVAVWDYLQLFRNTDQPTIKLLNSRLRDKTHYHRAQGAAATTWIISFKQIRQSAAHAAYLLSFMAFIEPKAIPRSLLPKPETEQEMTEAIGTLLGYGFLSQRGNEPLFDMHSLVHSVTLAWTKDQNGADRTREEVLAHLTNVFPTDDWKNRELWRQYLPHAFKALKIGRRVCDKSCQLEYWAGRCLVTDGRIPDAVELLEHVVAIRETTLAENHPSRLTSQHELAGAYKANGQIKEAVELLKHVVEMKKETMAENHPSRVVSEELLQYFYETLDIPTNLRA